MRPTLLEKSPIILEIGSLFTRIGISDESFPKRVIYTPQNLRAWLLTKDENNKTVILLVHHYFPTKLFLCVWANLFRE